MEGRRHFFVLLCLSAVFFFGRLGNPLLEPEEARYAEIPRQMLAEGRWLVPVLHGEDYLHKPPLFYWLVMGCYQMFGVHDWVARLVPGSAGILVVLATFWWGRAAVGKWVGFTSALILLLTPRFVFQTRMVTLDGLLTLWIVASWASGHRALVGDRLRCWILAGFFCGLGILTKGPVALVLVVIPLALWSYTMRPRGTGGSPVRSALDEGPPSATESDPGSHRRAACATGRNAWALFVLMALAVAGPWYVALAWFEPQAAVDFFWVHNVQRFVDPFDHVKPFWYYGPVLLLSMLPWTSLFIPAGRWLVKNRSASFFLLCGIGCVGFYSLSGCKRPGYILPAYPALALVLGSYVTALATGRDGVVRWPRWWTVGVASLGVVLLVAGQFFLDDYHRRFGRRGLIRRHLEQVHNENLQVACYPRRWDSVSFYLQREDVRHFEQEESLMRFVESRPTLLFVKHRDSDRVEKLRRSLPVHLEMVPIGRQSGDVFVGLVRPIVGVPALAGPEKSRVKTRLKPELQRDHFTSSPYARNAITARAVPAWVMK